MSRTSIALLFFCIARAAFAFDPLSIDPLLNKWPTNDEGGVAFAIIYGDDMKMWILNRFAAKIGNEKVAEMILGFIEPAIDEARVSADSSKISKLCGSGISALGHLGVTNVLPFLEKTVLHGERFSQTAFHSYGYITYHDKSFIDLGDLAVEKGALDRGYYIDWLDTIYMHVSDGVMQVTPESKLRIAAHIIGVPSGHWGELKNNDDRFLADFPFYRNSAERLANLTALIENSFTPPEVRAKYEPELKRLKALPPKKLINATERIEAQIAALPETEARKKTVAKIRRIAVPAVAVLICVALLVFIRKRRKHR